MPTVFKKLVDISVWILFVVACLAIILGILALIRSPGQTMEAARVVGSARFWGLGVFSFFLTAVTVWFRKVIG